MKILADYTLEELQEILDREFSCPKYRAKQLFAWIKSGANFDQMSNLPNSLLSLIKENYASRALEIITEVCSKDGSKKLLYRLLDDDVIEGVFMPHDYGNTLCVSSQVGCRMGCAFCASGVGGLKRNLSAGEIYSQVIESNKKYADKEGERAITNLVLMGSGEPLDNYDNVKRFIALVSCKDGLNISQRNISLSTCGIADGIKRLADDGHSVTLSLSLHSPFDEIRRTIMPIARKYSVAEVMNAAKYYFDKTGRRISLEYALIDGVNISSADAKKLREITKGFACHINLIMLNAVQESPLKPCTKKQASDFLNELKSLGLNATLRRSMGNDTSAACGQLRNLYVGQKAPVSSDKKP